MKTTAPHLAWLTLGLLGAVVFAWAFPRAFPWLPQRWAVSKDQAVALAQERLRDLGKPVANAYVDARLSSWDELEQSIWRLPKDRQLATEDRERLRKELLAWEVEVFARTAHSNEWTYRARIAPTGEIVELRLNVTPEAKAGAIDDAAARARADELLRKQGFVLARFEEPLSRSQQLESRTDRRLLYRRRSRPLGEGIAYGVEVGFAGDRLTGFTPWLEDPRKDEVERLGGLLLLGGIAQWMLPFLLLPLVTIAFMRRYHEGEVGVRRGVQIAGLAMGLALVATVLTLTPMGSSLYVGAILTRPQVSWLMAMLFFLVHFAPLAVLSALGWSVGEVSCRDRAPARLAAFDSLLKDDWANATVARASLQGLASGLVIAAGEALGLLVVGRVGANVSHDQLFDSWWTGATWFGLAMLASVAFGALYSELFGRLLLTSALERRLGSWVGGGLAALIGALILPPPVIALPMRWSLPIWLGVAAIQVLLFLRCGLATSFIAALTCNVLISSYAFLISGHAGLQFQACLPLVAVGLPLLISLRHLTSGKECVYRWDDVPPHVRRIAERERQRLELETARRIQSSILPELPPQLNGVEIAHAYLPATEVGGDFYDAVALEDGRLAVAVGDVAGHGVSSGLVMSMARSALAVQVTFNPEVEAVFSTLNRVVYQSARKRLLATLCYALLDPARRELLYANAGHLYPYLITPRGQVLPLEFVAYPLGVRADLEIEARLARLGSGDTLFFLSDGVVEARAEESEDLFGFERLEESLARNAHLGVERLRDAVLADVARHTQGAPREDDQTVLVLRVP